MNGNPKRRHANQKTKLITHIENENADANLINEYGNGMYYIQTYTGYYRIQTQHNPQRNLPNGSFVFLRITIKFEK